MDVQLVYATFPDLGSAEALGRELVERGLAACVTYWEAGTTYRWEGDVVEDEEALALFKTAPGERRALVEALEADHPYDTPCVLPVASEGGAEGYAGWVREVTGSPA
jgi:periplasmic divalent cation tolerance protein